MAVASGEEVVIFVGVPDSPCSRVTGTNRYFMINADIKGFNHSLDLQGQNLPVMNVDLCDIVKITIIKSDTQTYGFATDYYGSKGTKIQDRQSPAFPLFLASKAGQFRGYCAILRGVHYEMRDGLLNVS